VRCLSSGGLTETLLLSFLFFVNSVKRWIVHDQLILLVTYVVYSIASTFKWLLWGDMMNGLRLVMIKSIRTFQKSSLNNDMD
jgi:hypothetical protein